MDALKQLKLGERYELDQSYGLHGAKQQKMDELAQWARVYMDSTEGRPQMEFQYDDEKSRMVVVRIR